MKTPKISKKIWRTINILLIWLFFVWISFGQNIRTDILIKWLDSIDINKRDKENFDQVVQSFCQSLYDYNISIWELVYKSNESLFVYNICKYINDTQIFKGKKWFSDDPAQSYIKFTTNNNGKSINILNADLPWFNENTEEYIKALFDKIIGGYTSVYQASIFWYKNNNEKTVSDLVNEFSDKNFPGIKICATDQTYSYPRTCKILKEYFNWARNTINSNNYYLNDKIISAEFEKAPNCTDTSRNIIGCWLYWWEIKHFTNAVYNELLFYWLFVEYYSYILNNKSDFRNPWIINFDEKIKNNQNRISQLYNDIESSRKAIQITIKTLKEMQWTFPIHIWFLMYNEDIYWFAANLNKTLTPIYTLHDTMRNVQKKE